MGQFVQWTRNWYVGMFCVNTGDSTHPCPTVHGPRADCWPFLLPLCWSDTQEKRAKDCTGLFTGSLWCPFCRQKGTGLFMCDQMQSSIHGDCWVSDGTDEGVSLGSRQPVQWVQGKQPGKCREREFSGIVIMAPANVGWLVRGEVHSDCTVCWN